MKTGTVAILAALVIATSLTSGPTVFAGDPEPLLAPVCRADLNADSFVDRADLDRLLRFYGACKGCQEDLNQDNRVDDADVAIMTEQWGPCRPEGDVFGGDHSGDSLVDGSDSLIDGADSLSGTDMHRTTTTLVPTRCQADLNGDTFVDEQDMAQLLRHEGACVACEEDLNEDGFVDQADARIMDRQWGPCRPEGDVFGADYSGDSLIGGSDSLADGADSLADPDIDHTTTTTLLPSRCQGDLNGDSFVDEQDMAQLLRHEGTCVACEEDLNEDGFVDEADAQIIDRQWGPCRPEGDVFGADHSAGSLTGSSDSLSDMEDRAPDRTKRTPEDVNGDSFVDMVDILTVTEHVGQEPTGDKAFSDVNNDGRIDKYDIRAIAVYVITGESIGA